MKKNLLFLSILSLVFFFVHTVYTSEVILIKNPDFSIVKNGLPEGWVLRGNSKFYYDEKEKAAVITTIKTYDSFTQSVSLAPGHYLFKALIKANTSATSLVGIASLSISISEEYQWVELPFYVDGFGEKNLSVLLGIRRIYNDPSTHKGETRIKEVQLIRLGDTSLPRNWATKIPVHPLHKLETINDNPNWDRPGKVIFKDTFIGTELWLITQDGQVNLSYVGFQDFSHNGKYVQVGNRRPGYIMRTDGSHRYGSPSKAWPNRFLWLFPWEEKNLPNTSDPSDWIATIRTRKNNPPIRVEMLNLVTGETKKIVLPTIPEWDIAFIPSTSCGRGQDTKRITHNTLVWISKDQKKIGLSDTEGNNFKSFKIKSISKKPENDIVNPGMSAAWGKGGDNWHNSVDKDGNRYFAFELNKEKDFNDPENPYQVWMLPLNIKDTRGLLRVRTNPKVEITPGSYSRGRLIWWDLAAGQPPFSDSATLVLEDGTRIYMCSLGEHSGFGSTISTQCPHTNQVKFIGNYTRMDHISWPNEFQRNKDYAIVWAGGYPGLTVAMIDLWHDTFWTIFIKNSDYYERNKKIAEIIKEKQAGIGEARTAASLIVPAPTPSPDFTKVLYSSSMLALKNSNGTLGDAYIAIARYPLPPVNVQFKSKRLVWDKPQYNAEIMGYNIYYSKESGKGNWTKLNPKPVREMFYELPSKTKGFYVVTSVEHSGLESRIFSNEVSLGNNRLFRLFYQPEESQLVNPMVPFFEPKNASNCYAVAVTDPELIYKKQLEEGLEGKVKLKTNIPIKGRWKVMARVRGMSGIERESYTTGWQPQGEVGERSFTVKIGNKTIGNLPVEGSEWRWVEIVGRPIDLSTGKTEIVFSTSDTGIALDNILITNDLSFIPTNLDNTPTVKPSTPQKVKISERKGEGEPLEWRGYTIAPPYVRIEWELSTAPQGIRYYNIYRGEDKDFKVGPETIIGSETDIFFTDLKLKKGTEYYYKVVAVDNWDNRSEVSEALMIKIE